MRLRLRHPCEYSQRYSQNKRSRGCRFQKIQGSVIRKKMAEASDRDDIGSVVSKNRRNLTSGSANRIRNRLTRSPKRRAGTPEPEQRTFTDESEKDISDGEYLPSGGDKPKSGIRRFFSRKDKHDTARSKSLEPKTEKPESEEDFETILQMHKTKKMEDELKETKPLIEDSRSKVKEGLKESFLKEMPPLIVAPKDNKKRKRHKSLPLQESQSEEDKPKTPLMKAKTRNRKKTTSEDDTSNKSEDERQELRNRKTKTQMEKDKSKSEAPETLEVKTPVKQKSSIFSWFKKKKTEPPTTRLQSIGQVKDKTWCLTGTVREWQIYVNEHRDYYNSFMRLKNRCITDLLILLLMCGCGGVVFRFTEGAFESFYKCGVKRVKRDFIDALWKSSQYMLEEDWKSLARRKLMEFENQLHSAHEAGMTTYSGQKSWSFLNAVVYCLTVVTTIGYGHISPSTTTGRAITIIYAIFGIPMFLILLADFGKLFTRGIKFVWAFVRRLYYTGSCRKVRKTAPVQEVMKGMQIMYDFAKSRRLTTAGLEAQPDQHHLRAPEALRGIPETPSTPNWSAFEIDDEFNLPISVAITILIIYIFLGAFMYWIWEEWSFFESFYFVFISMSTIGFGDFVPQHPMYMMLSIVYLIFGLALTSMCINVVQEKLSDTFRQASAKLGTTIGLKVAEEVEIVTPEGLQAQCLELNQQQ